MKFTDIFIQRPVLSIVVSLLILILGIQAASSLSVRQYPRSDIAVITIETVYVGANAELIRGFITAPIERAVASAEGIDYIASSSVMGMSTIKVHLRLNYDPLKAMTEISAKVNQVRGNLPPEAEVPAIRVDSADSEFAAAYLSFSSEILEQNQITDFLTRLVQPRLTAVAGVQKAEVLGGRTFAMRIWLKPERMAALNVTPVQVRAALAANNVQAAIGQTRGSYTQVNLRADTDLTSVDEFRQMIIRNTADGIVRLSDIADVVLGAESYDVVVNYSGDTAVFMGVWVAPTANSLEVMKAVNEEMEIIKSELPTGLSGTVAYDSTEYIDAAIHEVIKTLTETLLIIVLVIFLFLGFSRSVIIPVLAIPLSLIGALFIMQICGFSLNLLTLLSIVLCVGLVVDDAIVMVENIERHIQEGLKPYRAAIVAARELAGPILAMTVTLASVYIPIGLQGGLTGTLFREFAITLAGAMTISAVVAITLSPMLGSRMLKPHKGLNAPLEKPFEKFKTWYAEKLGVSLENRAGIYVFWVVVAFLCVPLYMMSPKELAPTEDQGVIFGIVDAQANSTVDQSDFYGRQVNQALMSFPESDFTFQLTMPTGGFAGLVVKPWGDRERSVNEILPDVQAKLAEISGQKVLPVTPPALPGGGQFPFEFVLASTADIKEIYEYALKIQEIMVKSGKFYFQVLDVKVDQPDYKLSIDRNKVADLGLDLQTVTNDVGTLMGGGYVNRFNMAGQSYKVIPQVKRIGRLTPDDLANLYITGPDGGLIRLDQVASISHTTEPRTINRMQQLNAVKLSGVPGVPLGEALAFLEDEARKILPKSYSIDYTGETRQLVREGNTFLPALTLAIIMIFLVLAAQYNSFRDPLVILAGSVPLAMFGALIFTFLKLPMPMPFFTNGFTSTLNIYSQVGLVTLMGLIARNGILVVEFANKLQEQGRAKLDAIREAAVLRLRPVMMTSIATIAGHTPLIFASGPGAEARNSIGIVLVLGMTIGTFFTLFVLPSVYMLLAKDHQHDHEQLDELEEDISKA
ncbi:efflux RND transporter permease subunit [Cellvibrio japonicus]|uniref:AcrB/AcrD/AcrF family protein n=1 Tax=Cellvibrio japonicus (strain Ueda107) TaxID=498211 RepID=B3PKL4_CELJU|nr:efflux RND transporter permease subunit [Cellvibrio japonicus]ACE82871.1 AcrB/AcrD/AcrF family protein [Cellvibrio japonicus Ueda107]QEI12872.1 multidrug efflux protein [Cellvibrio japonicus]QEI16446.1 multidrug efflux protein [Cellvibrio japonicus]QEI20024.1 multidrug efflux protein [Cellvibrio japonicus]